MIKRKRVYKRKYVTAIYTVNVINYSDIVRETIPTVHFWRRKYIKEEEE